MIVQFWRMSAMHSRLMSIATSTFHRHPFNNKTSAVASSDIGPASDRDSHIRVNLVTEEVLGDDLSDADCCGDPWRHILVIPREHHHLPKPPHPSTHTTSAATGRAGSAQAKTTPMS